MKSRLPSNPLMHALFTGPPLRLSVFGWAWTCSFFLHIAVISLHFNFTGQFDRLVQNKDLPIILVNMRLKAPTNERAQALAQSNLNEGGEDNRARRSSPLPNMQESINAVDNEVLLQTLERQEQMINSLQTQQTVLTSQIRSELARMQPLVPEQESQALQIKRAHLLRMLAEIEMRIEEANKRPHKRFFSPSTKQSEFALYYEQMRQKIEWTGTKNFPTFKGQKLYGKLTMVLTVNAGGQVLSAEILKGSGVPELDRRAKALALSSGPFAPFGPALSHLADQLALVCVYTFTQGDTADLKLQQ